MQILIIDCHPLMMHGIKDALYSYNNQTEIYEANNFNTAIAHLNKIRFNLVIIDIHLENSDGFDIIDTIKSEYPMTKILIFTATFNYLEFLKANERNVNGFLLKNSHIDDFLYAYQVVLRNEVFYSMKIIEKMKENESMRLLTKRELQVLEKLSLGLSNTQISSQLYISEASIKKYISNILDKLGLSNRYEILLLSKIT